MDVYCTQHLIEFGPQNRIALGHVILWRLATLVIIICRINNTTRALNTKHFLTTVTCSRVSPSPQKEIHSSCPSARPAHSDNIGFGKQLAPLAPANLLRICFWLASFRNVTKFDCTMLTYISGMGLPVTQSASVKEGRKDFNLSASLCCEIFL